MGGDLGICKDSKEIKLEDMNREELVGKLIEIRNQEKEIRKELDKLDYEKRFEDSKKYLGKCYIEKTEIKSDYVRCIYVYSIDKDSCDTKSLCVHYYGDLNDSYFGIEYDSHFNPKKWGEEDKWIEITKDDFMEHYNVIQSRISKTLE